MLLTNIYSDTAVSFRPGARFGPRSIRHMSQQQTLLRGFNAMQGINPYANWAKVIDCGDIRKSFSSTIHRDQPTKGTDNADVQ